MRRCGRCCATRCRRAIGGSDQYADPSWMPGPEPSIRSWKATRRKAGSSGAPPQGASRAGAPRARPQGGLQSWDASRWRRKPSPGGSFLLLVHRPGGGPADAGGGRVSPAGGECLVLYLGTGLPPIAASLVLFPPGRKDGIVFRRPNPPFPCFRRVRRALLCTTTPRALSRGFCGREGVEKRACTQIRKHNLFSGVVGRPRKGKRKGKRGGVGGFWGGDFIGAGPRFLPRAGEERNPPMSVP